MAISPWAAKTKKSEVKDDSSEPSAKVPCTQYEKQLKKMEGNVGLVKEWALCRLPVSISIF